MIGLLSLLLAAALCADLLALLRAESELSVDIGVHELRAHVYRLASPEFLGRRGAGAARTARHLAAAFERLPLRPAFGASYYQEITSALADDGQKNGSFFGRNVGALLPGTDPKLKDEWILLCAHYDHLGERKGRLYPGADDNASGVAMLLEVAERFALQPPKPRRTLVFVAFDQEESGLLGSSHFALHTPLPFRQLKACLVADMLGRSMCSLMDEYVFALGSEQSPRLRALLEQTQPEKGLKVGRLGADLIGTRSDYGPFRDRKKPFLFFSTGPHYDYHRPTDLPDRIDYERLRKISLWISDLTGRLANDAESPAWDEKGLPPDLDEVRTIQILVKRVLTNPETMPLTMKQRQLVSSVEERLTAIVKRGSVTQAERDWLLWSARLLMATVF
jgi:hypothetical protein